MLFVVYDILFVLAALVWLPIDLVRGLMRGRRREGILQRFGFFSQESLAPLRHRRVVWIHAVSVGETRAAIPLIREIRSAWPDVGLVVSNVTETGHRISQGLPEVDEAIYFPLDLSFIVQRVIRLIAPDLVLIVETEIWPNFIRLLHRRGTPVMLVNGRFSDRSFPRYFKAKSLLKPVFSRFAGFCMQSTRDARRIQLLGAAAERVVDTGNLKFDLRLSAPLPSREALRKKYHLPAEGFVWVVGSTHHKEDEQIARVLRRLLIAEQEVTLVLAPRHTERCTDIAKVFRQYGFPFCLRSEIEGKAGALGSGEALLVDTMGDLLELYKAADVVFVGGSLVPVGGHNILEGLLVHRPVVWGPYMQNFKDISRIVLQYEAGVCAKNVDELYDVIRGLIDHPQERERLAVNGGKILDDNAGATRKTLKAIGHVLDRQAS